MDDDGGIYWFQTAAQEQEYLEWLDKIEHEKAIAEPVNQPVKESGNEWIDSK